MAPRVTRAASRRAEEVYTILRQTRHPGQQRAGAKSRPIRPVVRKTVEAQPDEDENENDADEPEQEEEEEEEDGVRQSESSDEYRSAREGSEPVANLIVNINRNLWQGVPYQERAQQRSGSSGRSSRRRRERTSNDSQRQSQSPSVKRKRTLEDSPAVRKSLRLRQTQRNTRKPGRPRKRARLHQRNLGAASPSLSVRREREPQSPRAPSPKAPAQQQDDVSEGLFLPGDDGSAEEHSEPDQHTDQVQHQAPVASATSPERAAREVSPGDAQMQAFRRSTQQMRLASQQQPERPRSSLPAQRPADVLVDEDSSDPKGSEYEDRVRERALRQAERFTRAQSQRQTGDAADAPEQESEPSPEERTARIRRIEERDKRIEAERAAKIDARREDGRRRLELFFASTRRMRQAG